MHFDLDRDPIGILCPPAGEHLKIVVSAVLGILVGCSQHSNARLSSKLNQTWPNLEFIQFHKSEKVFSSHRVVVFLQVTADHDNCARSRALNNNVDQIISNANLYTHC